MACNGVCVVIVNDPNNCGGCGLTCSGSDVCSQGLCKPASACSAGLVPCAGQCIDPNSSSLHCGGCPGTACAAGKGCSAGACVDVVPLDGGGPTCTNGGPPIYVGSDAGSYCAGTLAQVTFRWGICTCGDLFITSGSFASDAFDSTRPGQDGGLGASLGANGRFRADSFYDVGGSVWSGNTQGFFNTSNAGRVRRDLVSNGSATGGGAVTIDRDAFINGDAQTGMTVGGTLYLPTGRVVGASVTATAGVVRQPVSVAPPCDCAANQLIDVAGIVLDGQARNDNALLGLNPTALANSPGPRRLDLPCGRYFLTSIDSAFPNTIAVHGRTALFIGGDLDTSRGNIDVAIDPQAELDLFIGGTIRNSTGLSLGNLEVPAQLRVYVAGSPVDMSAPSRTAGNYYLPNSAFLSPSNLNLFGSIFARSFEGQGVLHYDRGVLSAGEACRAPTAADAGVRADGGTFLPDGGAAPDAGAPVCTSCRGCGNQACISGTCGSCRTDADCCAPLFCSAGLCFSIN